MRLVLAITLLAASLGAFAQGYPTRPVKLIVADSAGGAPDQLARLLAEKLSTGLGQQVVVENRAGAGGVLGAEAAAKSAPDDTVATGAGTRPKMFAAADTLQTVACRSVPLFHLRKCGRRARVPPPSQSCFEALERFLATNVPAVLQSRHRRWP